MDGPPPTIAYLLSRQKRRPAPQDWWIRATAAVAEWTVAQGYHLYTSGGLLHLDFARWAHGSAGGAVTLVDIHDHPSMRRIKPVPEVGLKETRYRLATQEAATKDELYRRRDAFILHSADTLVAIAVRKGGVMERLGRDAVAAGKQVLVMPPPGQAKQFAGARTLLDAGATPLFEIEAPPEPETREELLDPLAPVSAESFSPEDYLWHYTRGCAGPWPGQTYAEYFRSLVNNARGAAHSGRDTLRRIIDERRIRASGHLIRGQYPVVCFSAKPPVAMMEMRRYRHALIRWTFEPYGIGVHKERARVLGIHPVQYAAREDYSALPEPERWLYQAHAPPTIDWTVEQEYRHRGDFHLDHVPEDTLAFFADGEYFTFREKQGVFAKFTAPGVL